MIYRIGDRVWYCMGEHPLDPTWETWIPARVLNVTRKRVVIRDDKWQRRRVVKSKNLKKEWPE